MWKKVAAYMPEFTVVTFRCVPVEIYLKLLRLDIDLLIWESILEQKRLGSDATIFQYRPKHHHFDLTGALLIKCPPPLQWFNGTHPEKYGLLVTTLA